MKPGIPKIGPISVASIEAARGRIAGSAQRTPLLPLDIPAAEGRIWLKLECLQPIGSFKIRGAANALALADPSELSRGVYTASAGNMAQGVAFAARRRGVACRVIVPEGAPAAKTDAVERLGGSVVHVPFEEWWSVLVNHGHPDEAGFFVHPVSDPAVIAGNGTIGLELLEQLERFDTVIVPYGGGGLSSGIASALQQTENGGATPASRSPTRVFASEVDTAAPFAASMRAGYPVEVTRTPSFVDGIGSSSVLADMWPLTSKLLSGSLVVTLDEVRFAIRTLVEHAHVVAEGAGASSVAAALRRVREEPGERIVAIVSGGNLDTHVLMEILEAG